MDDREKRIRTWTPASDGRTGDCLHADLREALIDRQLRSIHAGGVVLVGLLLFSAHLAKAADSTAASPLEQTLAGIRECMDHPPAPWPEGWQREYVDTVRRAAESHPNEPDYPSRLEILSKGFPAYWQGLKTGKNRSLFELHCAQIRWYVEGLMAAELGDEPDRQKLRTQYKALCDHAAGALLAQFPFLDPNAVRAAQADHLAECYAGIQAPLLPIYQHPLSDAQLEQIKTRWHELRYARVDLYRQLGGDKIVVVETQDSLGVAGILPAIRGRDALDTENLASHPSQSRAPISHPHYLLTQRSLAQLQPHIWAVVARPPDYYRAALAKQIEAEKRRLAARSQASRDERRLEQQYSRQIWQAEQLAFLLAALLESPPCFGEPSDRPIEGDAGPCRDVRFCVSPAQPPLPQEDSPHGGNSHD